MSGHQEGDGDNEEVTIVTLQSVKQEEEHAPLLVAMQPGVEIPAIGVEEVIVVTEGYPEGVVEQVAIETDGDHGDMVGVGAIEEIDVKPSIKARISNNSFELEDGSFARRSMVYNREGVKASKGPPPDSSGDSETDPSEDEDDDDDDGIPMMHSHGVREVKKREFAYRLQWRNKDMLEAMKSVEDKKMTIRGAAKKFMVPYSTLKDRVHGRVRHGTKPGVKTALSPEEEEELVRYVKDMEAAGFQMRNSDVRERAGELLRLNYGHSSPYGEGCSPGHNWLQGFLKRHQGVEFKRQVARSIVPSCTKQRALIKKFYDITGQVYKKNRIQTKPERVYSVTEMKIGVFQRATILYCGSAAGTAIPPFVVFKGQQKLKLTSAREAYPQAFFTSSYSGQVTEEIFLWWFRDHFLKVIHHAGNRPLVLLISQPCINVSLQMYQLAKEERVIFISIPSGVNHLLQPMDDELSTYIENCLSKKARKWEAENPGAMFTQKILAQLLQKVWKKALTVDEITHKFSNVGISPLNPSAISTDKILAMSHAMRENLRQSPSPEEQQDTEEMEEDDPLQGLSLLSALSSHEYASISRGGATYGSQDNLNQEVEPPRKAILEEFMTPSTSAQPSKRRRLNIEEEPAALFHGNIGDMMEEVPHTVVVERPKSVDIMPKGATLSRLEKNPQNVQSEIALARENLDQINRAVDSILSSEAEAETSSPLPKSPHNTRSADSVKVIKLKMPTTNNKPTYTVTSPKKLTPKVAAPVRTSTKKVRRRDSQPAGKATKKIIFMLNKDGQLVSRTEVTPRMNEMGDTLQTRVQPAVAPTLREALTSNAVFSNIKVERDESHVREEVVEEVFEETVENVTDVYTSPTTDQSYVDPGFSITNPVEEQPPQHLLQDEDLDLDNVDTIMINGQLFRVIRAPKEPVVKQESTMQVQLEQGMVAEDNVVIDNGVVVNMTEGASVIHQEVVEDYEVASFEVQTDGTTVHTGQTIIEEQVV